MKSHISYDFIIESYRSIQMKSSTSVKVGETRMRRLRSQHGGGDRAAVDNKVLFPCERSWSESTVPPQSVIIMFSVKICKSCYFGVHANVVGSRAPLSPV